MIPNVVNRVDHLHERGHRCTGCRPQSGWLRNKYGQLVNGLSLPGQTFFDVVPNGRGIDTAVLITLGLTERDSFCLRVLSEDVVEPVSGRLGGAGCRGVLLING